MLNAVVIVDFVVVLLFRSDPEPAIDGLTATNQWSGVPGAPHANECGGRGHSSYMVVLFWAFGL